jgi:teichuronic acid exporter
MSLKIQALHSLKWSFFNNFSNQLINFFLSIYLTRLLLPSEIGLMGMIYVFFTLGTVLIDSGLNTSLIRNKNIDDDDLSTVFFSNIFFAILFYSLLYIFAPLIAKYYNQIILTNLIRIQGLTLILSSFYTIQSTILTKELHFKRIGIISLLSLIFGGFFGVIFAYSGFGVWSIVIMNITSAIISLLFFWMLSSWKPKFIFNPAKFKYHFFFGYKLLISRILDAVYTNVFQLIIGKIFNPTTNGYYARSDSFKRTIIFGISTPLNSVLLPILSKVQDDNEKLKNIYILILQLVILVIAPILLFCSVFSLPIFEFLFTSKWNNAAPYFQILCLAGILYPIDTYMVSFLSVKGRSDLILKIDILKRVILTLAISFAILYKDISYLLWLQVIVSIINFFINTFVLKSMLNYKIVDQYKNISNVLVGPIISATICLFLYSFYLKKLHINLLIIAIGLFVFCILNTIFIFFLNKNIILKIKELIKK